ncbi:MAG: BamA/TamA family outer membrane protein [Bacteroidota bacterium]
MPVKLIKYLFIFALVASLFSCRSTRYVPEGEYLISKAPKYEGNLALDDYSLNDVVRNQPNQNLLGRPFYLYAYNFGRRIKKDSVDKGIRAWLSRQLTNDIGEAPQLLDTTILKQDRINIRNAYFAAGYFYPKVSYRIDTLGKEDKERNKVGIVFTIEEGTAYRYRNVKLQLKNPQDSAFLRAYQMPQSAIKQGQNYSHDKMALERSRATLALRNAGYFTFSPSMIDFEVDTLITSPQERDLQDSLNVKWIDIYINVTEQPQPYYIRNVLMEIQPPGGFETAVKEDIITFNSVELNQAIRDSLHITERKLSPTVNLRFKTSKNHIKRLNFNFLNRRVLVRQGERYSQDRNRQTLQRLQNLGMFRFVVVNYQPIDSTNLLDIRIETQLAKKYQIRVGTEGFSNDIISTNLPSVGSNIVFRDRNAFRHSEFLELSLAGNVGLYQSIEEENNRALFYELAANTRLNFNRFLIPFPVKADLSQLSPYTTLSANYRLESRLEFNRVTTGGQLSYRWNHIPFSDQAVSRLTPFFVDLIDVRNISDAFQEQIDNLPLIIQRDYERRFGSRIQYSFTYQNYGKNRIRPTYWYRTAVEIGGNLPFLIDALTQGNNNDESLNDNLLFNRIFYGQYLKGSFENKWLFPIDQQSELVARAFLGASYTYNNTPTVPYESRFFTGGTNSMRGWISNTLGPGRSSLSDFISSGSVDSVNLSLLAPGGEFILEANLEYRVDVWSYLEMAFFTDVGNVWFHEAERTREQLGDASIIALENLALGWDAGIGFRFDFSFLILRFDLAQQLFAPDLERGWVLGNPEAAESKRWQLNVGINYPF